MSIGSACKSYSSDQTWIAGEEYHGNIEDTSQNQINKILPFLSEKNRMMLLNGFVKHRLMSAERRNNLEQQY